MRRNDFIDTNEFTEQELINLMNLAIALKACIRADYFPPLLQHRTLGLALGDCGCRMSSAFITAMRQFGGRILFIDRVPEVRDSRRFVENYEPYLDCIAARTNKHEAMLTLSKYASIPVINGGSDFNQPLQELSDLITMFEHLPRERRLEDCKLVYEGPGNAECASLLYLTSKMGMQFVQIAPSHQQLKPQVTKIAERNIKKSGGAYLITDNAAEGFREANFLRLPPGSSPSPLAAENGVFLVDPFSNYVTALRAVLLLMLYRDPAAKDTLMIEKMRRTLAVKLHEVFGYGEG